jgi:AcrR family transcriptional regulator
VIKTTIKNPDLVRKRQKQICRGALKVFRKKGFHATSMREIARSTGISLGNLYDYIEKKEDILFLVHKDILEQISLHFDETFKNDGSPVEQLVNAVKEVVTYCFRIKEEILFIFTETKSLERKNLHEILRMESEFVSKIEALIENGMKQGVFHCHSPAALANVIGYNLYILAMRGWSILPGQSEQEFIDELVRFSLKGLGVETGHL